MNATAKILLVDDDPAILLTVGDQLRFEGYTVIKAASAEQALANLAADPPDLIVLDVSMPGIGGLAFLRQITDTDGSLKHPVLVFTARAELDQFFKDTQVSGFLPKTADPSVFSAEVARLIAEHRRLRVASTTNAGPWSILLVEDEPEVSRRVTTALEAAGYEVLHATGANDALEKAVLLQPDCIALKYVLLHMNGPAVATTLGTMPRTSHIPIVLYEHAARMDRPAHYPHVRLYLATQSPDQIVEAVDTVRRQARG